MADWHTTPGIGFLNTNFILKDGDTATGNFVFTPISNSTATFKVTTSGAGATIFTVDTTNSKVIISALTVGSLSGAVSASAGVLSAGTLSVTNGGSGAATLTGIVKGNGTSAFTAAVAGTDYLAPTGSGQSLTLSQIGVPTYSTAQHLMNFSLSPGVSSGGAITASATANAVDIAAGTGFVKATDSNVATLSFFDWPASSAVSVPSGATRYIGVEYNAGSPQVIAKTAQDWDYDTNFPLGIVVNEGGTRYIINIPWVTADNTANVIERFDSEFTVDRDNRSGGLIVSNTGTRNVAVTAGILLARMSEFSISAIDTSVSGSFDAYYRDGAGGWTKQASQTQWDNTKYDDGDGTLGDMALLTFASRWWYLMTDGTLAMLYGQSNLGSLAVTLNEGAPSSVPPRIQQMGMLIGRFIIQASGTTPSTTQTAFGTSFTASQVTSASDLSNGVTGSGKIVLDTSPTLVTPALGTPTALVGTNITGTAASLTAGKATILETARTINGTSFDGSANITVTAAAGTLTGTVLNSTVVTSSLVTLGTLTSLTVNSATITLSQDTNFVLSGGVNGVSFDTNVLSIDATNDRVGIGTAAPTYKLDVIIDDATNTGITDVLSLQHTTSGTASGEIGTGINFSSERTDGNMASLGRLAMVTTAHGAGAESGAFVFQTRNLGSAYTERVRISSNGYVGIGGTPTAQFEVLDGAAPEIRLNVVTFGVADTATLSFSAATTVVGHIQMISNESSYVDMVFKGWVNNVLTEFLRFDANGTSLYTPQNFGIGTTAPVSNIGFTAKVVDVSSTGVGVAYTLHDTDTTQEASMGSDGGGIYIDVAGHATATNNNIIFRTGRTNSSYALTTAMKIFAGGTATFGSATDYGAFSIDGMQLYAQVNGEVIQVNRLTTDGTLIGFRQAGTEEGTISVSGTTVSYNGFTGSHFGKSAQALVRGDVLITTGIAAYTNGRQTGEPIYAVVKCTVENDKRVAGAYLDTSESQMGSSRVCLMAAVGNFDIWVVDEGENIQTGDCLITSTTSGHARKELPLVRNYSVAKAMENIDWSLVTATIGGKKHKKISVYFAFS